jgi:alpha-glucoside transport system substrate-binding protein
MRRRTWISALVVGLCAIAAAIVAATAGSSAKASPNAQKASTIEVFSLWSGSEKAAFLNVTAAFTAKTGINVKYTDVRDFIPEITSRLAAGNPPDIAIVPRPGYIATLAKQGVLKPIGKLGFSSSYIKARYGTAWTRYARVGGNLYGIPAKANSKSVIWYHPDSFKKYQFKPPATFAQLLTLTKKYKAKHLVPWAVGAGPGPSSWTLTDWFENLYARTAGPAKYQQLFTGKLPFTDNSVVNALKLMTSIVNNKYLYHGVQGALGMSFQDGINAVFAPKPKAWLYYEGGFVGGIAIGQFNPKLKPGKTINWFPWPTVNPKQGKPVTVGGDYAVAFKDSPEVRTFLKYISTGAAGKIWVKTGAIISPNKQTPSSAYPNLLVRNEGKQLASANVVLFDGSDQLPGAFGDTWGSTLQNVIQHPSSSAVKKQLAAFQKKIKGKF